MSAHRSGAIGAALVRSDGSGAPSTLTVADDGFHPTALDWAALEANGLPEARYLEAPYFPEGARVWGWGPAESGKSMFGLWLAAKISRQGLVVVYVSQENPLVEDVRRLRLLRPDWRCMRFFHQQGFDLGIPDHVAALLEVARGASLVVLDTLTATWSGDGEKNREIGAFDRDVQIPLCATGATLLVLDHTGHAQPFIKRRGAEAGRGASSKGQKADVTLTFRPKGDREFEIEHGKARIGGDKQPPRLFRVVDTDDEGLDIEEVERPIDEKVAELADRMVEAVEGAGFLTTNGLRAAAPGGRDTQTAAMRLLEREQPPRLRVGWDTAETEKGRQRAKVWRLAGSALFEGES